MGRKRHGVDGNQEARAETQEVSETPTNASDAQPAEAEQAEESKETSPQGSVQIRQSTVDVDASESKEDEGSDEDKVYAKLNPVLVAYGFTSATLSSGESVGVKKSKISKAGLEAGDKSKLGVELAVEA